MSAAVHAEHPSFTIGPQNKHVLDTLCAAYRAGLALAEEGFTILGVEVGTRNPVVWVQNAAPCAALGGAAKLVRKGAWGCRETTMVAAFMNCQIQWRVRGH